MSQAERSEEKEDLLRCIWKFFDLSCCFVFRLKVLAFGVCIDIHEHEVFVFRIPNSVSYSQKFNLILNFIENYYI